MIGYFNTYLSKYYTTTYKKSYTILGLSLILIIVFFVFAIKPTIFTALELRQKLKQGQAANESLDKKIQILNSAQTAHKEAVPQLILVDLAVPKESRMVSLLNQVNLLALQNELNVETLVFEGGSLEMPTQVEEIQAEEESAYFSKFIFHLSAQGGYAQIEKFLFNLENLPRLVSLVAVEIIREEGEELLTLDLRAEVFYRSEETQSEKEEKLKSVEGNAPPVPPVNKVE